MKLDKDQQFDSYNLSSNRKTNDYDSYIPNKKRKANNYKAYVGPKVKENSTFSSISYITSRDDNTYDAYASDTEKPINKPGYYEASTHKSVADKFSRKKEVRVADGAKIPLKYSYETDTHKSVADKFSRKKEVRVADGAKIPLKYSYETDTKKRDNKDNKSYKSSHYEYDIKHSNGSKYKNHNSSLNSSFKSLLHDNCIYDRSEIEWYDKFNRFGCLDPYNRLNNTKEYLFFTKPDLHIWEPNTTTLNPQLEGYPYFLDLSKRYPYIVHMLQRSAGGGTKRLRKNPFMAILSNSVKNSLDIDDISANDIETATNMFGTKMKYRDHTWSNDEDIDFSLEFEDTKYLEIYNMLKAYDQYNRLAQFGIVDPPNLDGAKVSNSGYNYNSYIKNRENIETFGIFKFIVGEDYETLIYWAYLCGCYFKNVPRGTFGDLSNGDTLKYNVQFHAFSVEDSTPEILEDFNNLIIDAYGELPGIDFPIYNSKKGRVDGGWAKIPYISKVTKKTKNESFDAISDMQYIYKLKWRK